MANDVLDIPKGGIEPIPYERTNPKIGNINSAPTVVPGLIPAVDPKGKPIPTKAPAARQKKAFNTSSIAYNGVAAANYALAYALNYNTTRVTVTTAPTSFHSRYRPAVGQMMARLMRDRIHGLLYQIPLLVYYM